MEDLHTEDMTDQRTWTMEEIPVLTAGVLLPRPVTADGPIPRRIRRYYQLQSRAYLRYCEKWLLPRAKAEYRAALASSTSLPCFRAELTYRVTYHDGGLWSLYTQSREVTGETQLTRRGDTWDLMTGYPVPLADFFPPRSHWRQQLLETAAEEIRRQERSRTARYHDGWPRKLRRAFDPQNYYLTEEGLTFFFPMYAIAPAAEGIPTFTLPCGKGGLSAPPHHQAG